MLTGPPLTPTPVSRVSAQEMSEDPCTPKEEKQERLSRHKETMQRSQAEEEAHLLAQQRLVYDRSCRALKRRSVVRRHEMEQEQLREVRARRQNPRPSPYCAASLRSLSLWKKKTQKKS